MLLDSSDSVRLVDFAGSSLDNSPSTVNYEVQSRLPGLLKPSKQSDIFALGSAIYEMATGVKPYEKMSYREVQKLYAKKAYQRQRIFMNWVLLFENVGGRITTTRGRLSMI